MPTIQAHTAAGTMTGTQAAFVASRARKLLRAGRLTHHDFAVVDALLWGARKPGADRAVVAYSRLQSLAHVARATVAKAITRLQALGLVQRVKRRALVVWSNGGRAWRQLANEYSFRCEFTGQEESQKIEILQIGRPSSAEVTAAQAALAARRRQFQAGRMPTEQDKNVTAMCGNPLTGVCGRA